MMLTALCAELAKTADVSERQKQEKHGTNPGGQCRGDITKQTYTDVERAKPGQTRLDPGNEKSSGRQGAS